MPNDYISRSKFDLAMQERYCFNCKRKGNHPIFGVACKACWVMDMLDEIEDFPHDDVVEVVRCRECAHLCMTGFGTFCFFHPQSAGGLAPDDFCSAGERRSGDE